MPVTATLAHVKTVMVLSDLDCDRLGIFFVLVFGMKSHFSIVPRSSLKISIRLYSFPYVGSNR